MLAHPPAAAKQLLAFDVPTFALWSFIVLTGYYGYGIILRSMTERFRSLDEARRRYVVKNVLKSGLIYLLAAWSVGPMWEFIVESKEPDNIFIHTIGLLYAVPDIYALWFMAQTGLMSSTTMFHHICVGILAMCSLLTDFTKETFWVAMLVYAHLSMWTGIVNFYLGIRFLLDRTRPIEDLIRRSIAMLALGSYVCCCAVNWVYQARTIGFWLLFRWHQLSWAGSAGLLAYCAMIALIVNDDLVLMGSLLKERHAYKPKEALIIATRLAHSVN